MTKQFDVFIEPSDHINKNLEDFPIRGIHVLLLLHKHSQNERTVKFPPLPKR